jgi:hypothetical protein
MDLFFKHSPEFVKSEESAYYYWYLYMQLVEGYDEAHPLWEFFGNVNIPFKKWWIKHQEIFQTGLELGVWELETNKEIKEAQEEGAIILRLDKDCSRQYLLECFKEIMDVHEIGTKAGRKDHKAETNMAKFPFYQRPEVRLLKKTYDVLIMRSRRPTPTLYEIGCTLKLNPSAELIGKNDPSKSDKINRMNATVSRYLRQANQIKANVAKGDFPKFT